MKISVVIQARMSSSRLPGKVLTELGGVSILEMQYRILRSSRHLDLIVLATSEHSSDDPLQDFAEKHRIPLVRGDLENVAARFVSAIERFDIQHLVRHCADRPFMDLELLEQGIALYRESGADIVTNVLTKRFPKGQTVEIVRSDLLRENISRFQAPEDTEHVTRYFYRHADRFNIREILAPDDYSDVNLCLDTPADLAIFREMLCVMKKPLDQYRWIELAELYRVVQGR